jgi:hypothetical protein
MRDIFRRSSPARGWVLDVVAYIASPVVFTESMVCIYGNKVEHFILLPSARRWCVFIARLSLHAHAVQQVLSLRLKEELSKLAAPYIALDFDQHAIAQDRIHKNVRVAEFETFEHHAKYGRPLYAFSLSVIVIQLISS